MCLRLPSRGVRLGQEAGRTLEALLYSILMKTAGGEEVTWWISAIRGIISGISGSGGLNRGGSEEHGGHGAQLPAVRRAARFGVTEITDLHRRY